MKKTSIALDEKTKSELNSLDFVRKQTYKQIIKYLIDFYNKNKRDNKNE